MRGIEPLMSEPRRKVAAVDDLGGEALFHLVDPKGSYPGHQGREPCAFDLQESGLVDRLDRCVTFLFRKPLPALFQLAFILYERRALLFQCACHKALLVHADRAMNEGHSIDTAPMLEGKDERAARRGEVAPPPGSIR